MFIGEAASPEALVARLQSVAERFDILRMKGFAAVAGKPLRLAVQAWARGFAPSSTALGPKAKCGGAASW